ncbi:hypothetical protein NL676_033761 [Syzygium grande]|nr:hypothetical protein NL676_033761 [Syzygium grande]
MLCLRGEKGEDPEKEEAEEESEISRRSGYLALCSLSRVWVGPRASPLSVVFCLFEGSFPEDSAVRLALSSARDTDWSSSSACCSVMASTSPDSARSRAGICGAEAVGGIPRRGWHLSVIIRSLAGLDSLGRVTRSPAAAAGEAARPCVEWRRPAVGASATTAWR